MHAALMLAHTRAHCSVRAAFDPRSFEKILAKRNEEAQESAARFADDYKSGALSPSQSGAGRPAVLCNFVAGF